MTQRSKWANPRAREYLKYKERVRLVANTANVPQSLGADERFSVVVNVSWKKRQRCDLDNVIKGILDALWRDDRRVVTMCISAQEETGEESASISVERLLS